MRSWPGIVDDGAERATVAPAEDVERVLADIRRAWESPLPPITLYLTPSEAVATVLRQELAARGSSASVVVAPGAVAADEVVGVRLPPGVGAPSSDVGRPRSLRRQRS